MRGSGAKYLIFSVIAIVVVITDQITKLLIERNLDLGQIITIIPNFFDIHYIRNTGAAFGLMSRLPDSFRLPFLIIVSMIAMLLIGYLFVTAKKERTGYIISLSLVFSGAIGNLIDRVFIGEVRDFVDLHIYNLHWPVFNIADSAITVGIILLTYELLVIEPRLAKQGEKID